MKVNFQNRKMPHDSHDTHDVSPKITTLGGYRHEIMSIMSMKYMGGGGV
jgi:hypothetical protein